MRQRAGGGYLPRNFGRLGAGMAPGVKLLLAALLLGMLVAPAVTACSSSGDPGSPCDLESMGVEELKISGPNVDGCDAELHKQVSDWEFFGLGMAWQYGAPAPTGAPVCTVTSGEQTWSFYDVGGKDAASTDCQMVKTKRGLQLWQLAQQQAG
jgi:hypothetical protein